MLVRLDLEVIRDFSYYNLAVLKLSSLLKAVATRFFSPGSFGNGENGAWEYDECLMSGNSEDESKRSA